MCMYEHIVTKTLIACRGSGNCGTGQSLSWMKIEFGWLLYPLQRNNKTYYYIMKWHGGAIGIAILAFLPITSKHKRLYRHNDVRRMQW